MGRRAGEGNGGCETKGGALPWEGAESAAVRASHSRGEARTAALPGTQTANVAANKVMHRSPSQHRCQ